MTVFTCVCVHTREGETERDMGREEGREREIEGGEREGERKSESSFAGQHQLEIHGVLAEIIPQHVEDRNGQDKYNYAYLRIHYIAIVLD